MSFFSRYKHDITTFSSSQDYIVCCICRNENKYIEEFCEYYFKLGFTKIILCDNHKTPDDDILKDSQYIQHIINQKRCLVIIDPNNSIQISYYEFIANNCNYKYCLFVDTDEFLIIESYNTIESYTNQHCFKDADVILFNWKCYGFNNQLCYEPFPVMERFTKADDVAINRHVKTLLKKQTRNISFATPHIIKQLNDFVFKNAKGNVVIDFSNANGSKSVYEPIHTSAWINHYWSKSIEEFIEKYKRGYPDGNLATLERFFGNSEIRSNAFLERVIYSFNEPKKETYNRFWNTLCSFFRRFLQ